MTWQTTSTADTKEATIAILVFGLPGVGKTRMMATIPEGEAIILNFDGGTLSLSDVDIPSIDCTEMDPRTIARLFDDALAGESIFRGKKWICLDSVTEMAEQLLREFKASNKDGRAAYGELNDFCVPILRRIKTDTEHNWYITCQTSKDSQAARPRWAPHMPGSKLSAAIAHIFSLVGYLEADVDAEGEMSAVLNFRSTPTDRFDGVKSRSAAVEHRMWPDLDHILSLVRGES